MKKTTLFLFASFISFGLLGQTQDNISIPSHGDKYSAFVKQLENGQTDIDYKVFRESFIESEQFRTASRKKSV